MNYNEIKKDAKSRMDKAVKHLQEMLRAVRTGQASPALVENMRVDYYGTMTPISQLGAISIPEPRQIMIKPFDAGILKEIGRAIAQADLGAAPQDDGKLLRIELPALSGDQRKKYASKVKELCEEARIALRNGRRDANKHADSGKKDGDLTEDENRKLHDDIQALLKEYEGKVDEILNSKTKEVLEV